MFAIERIFYLMSLESQIEADVYSGRLQQNTTLAPSPIRVIFTHAMSAVSRRRQRIGVCRVDIRYLGRRAARAKRDVIEPILMDVVVQNVAIARWGNANSGPTLDRSSCSGSI